MDWEIVLEICSRLTSYLKKVVIFLQCVVASCSINQDTQTLSLSVMIRKEFLSTLLLHYDKHV